MLIPPPVPLTKYIQTVAALGREEAVMQQFDKSASKYIAKVRDLAVAAVGFGVGVGSFLTLSAIIMVSYGLKVKQIINLLFPT